MLTRLTVPLSPDERQALIQLADKEARDPRRQAALIIRQKLEELGLLPLKTTETETEANHE